MVGISTEVQVEILKEQRKQTAVLDRIAAALEALVKKPNSAEVEASKRATAGRLGI